MMALDGQANCINTRFCLSLLVFEIPILHMRKRRALGAEASIGLLVRFACMHGRIRSHVPASTLLLVYIMTRIGCFVSSMASHGRVDLYRRS